MTLHTDTRWIDYLLDQLAIQPDNRHGNALRGLAAQHDEAVYDIADARAVVDTHHDTPELQNILHHMQRDGCDTALQALRLTRHAVKRDEQPKREVTF